MVNGGCGTEVQSSPHGESLSIYAQGNGKRIGTAQCQAVLKRFGNKSYDLTGRNYNEKT